MSKIPVELTLSNQMLEMMEGMLIDYLRRTPIPEDDTLAEMSRKAYEALYGQVIYEMLIRRLSLQPISRVKLLDLPSMSDDELKSVLDAVQSELDTRLEEHHGSGSRTDFGIFQ